MLLGFYLCLIIGLRLLGWGVFPSSAYVLRTHFTNTVAPSSISLKNSTFQEQKQPSSSPKEEKTLKKVHEETHQFQAQVSKVMDIIVKSLYTQRDIFLRELVSNASDACDKIQKSHPNAQKFIRIKADKDERTLTVEDTGIGMSKSELIQNLGTIAQSGTAKFIDQLDDRSDGGNLIGQFGVGFYSSFLVAHTVEFVTKKEGEEGLRWKSSSNGTFTIFDEPLMIERGSKVILHLKDDCDEFLEDFKIKDLLKKYSEFVEYPIDLWAEKIRYERVPQGDDGTKMKTVTVRCHEWERVNCELPIWRRSQNDLKDSDYNDFYKSAFKMYDDPMAFSHFKVEGEVEFCAVLYIPGALPYELSKNMFDETSRGLRLYVRRVFINDNFTDSLPRWLKFLRGVVDSADLPLNVGREYLQKSRLLDVINRKISQKAIDMMKGLKGGEKWKFFMNAFGKYLKVGIVEDRENQEELASLIEFCSSVSVDKPIGLDKYIDNMQKDQKAIYYVAIDSHKSGEESPTLEKLKKLNFEVLYCFEPIDEFALSALAVNRYRGFEILDANKSDLKLPTPSADSNFQREELAQRFEKLCQWLKETLKGFIQEACVTDRLTESPCVLVQGDMGLSPTMQKYMRQQASSQGMSEQDIYGMNIDQATLELNPTHPLIISLNHKLNNSQSEAAKQEAWMLYHVAALQGGYPIENSNQFAKEITRLMSQRVVVNQN